MEQCQSLGTAGDVILFAPDGYACIVKGGIESFMSIHLLFDYDETQAVFKWRFQDGRPALRQRRADSLQGQQYRFLSGGN